MHRLAGLSCLGVLFLISVSARADRLGPGRHGPVQLIHDHWRRGQALRQLERAVHADPRLEAKFEQRFGLLGGKKQFSNRGAWAALGIGTAVNIGGFIQSNLLIPYLIAGAAVDLSAFAGRFISTRRMRRQTMLSLIKDGSIPARILEPHRGALGLPAPHRR
jgi:hypothetical protein